MKKTNIILFIILSFSIINCKKQAPKQIQSLEDKIGSDNNNPLIDSLNIEYSNLLKDSTITANEKEKLGERAYNFFKNHQKPAYSSTYLIKLIQDYPHSNHAKRVKELIKLLDNSGDKELSEDMKSLFMLKYPEDTEFKADNNNKVNGNAKDFDLKLSAYSDKLYGSIDSMKQPDILAAKKFINLCSMYALINPDNPKTPEYLFKAGQISQFIGMNEKAVEFYGWIDEKFPKYPKAHAALFIKGFILDDKLKRYDEAKMAYEKFLRTYPQSPYSKDVKVSLQYLGKSEAEILKSIHK